MKAIKIADGKPVFTNCGAPKGEGVLVKVVSSSICGTDLHLLPSGMLEGRIPGHEFAGYTPNGKAVAIEPFHSCGSCVFCDDGLIHHCKTHPITANIAKPGSGSMSIHSDLSLVLPEPWHSLWSLNVIWCLDDVYGENGATLFMPGSHKFKSMEEVPDDLTGKMIPFEAKAGSIIVMEGRIWHTSGMNRTKDKERAMLFGYYSRSFIRPQWNFNVALSEKMRAGLSPELEEWLGLGLTGNTKISERVQLEGKDSLADVF